MASFSSATVVGNLCRDIELRYTPGGTAVADVSVAVNDKRKNAAGEYVERVSFIDITIFGRTAEVAAEYLKKGSQALFHGRLEMDQWEGKDGQKRSKLKIVADTMQLLGGKGGGRDGGEGGSQRSESNRQPFGGCSPGEDIPF